jgi:hypothetical protein
VTDLQLFPTAPPLNARQQAIMDALQRAGQDGIDAIDAGAISHSFVNGRSRHNPTIYCDYCPREGLRILDQLRGLGLVKYRRRKGSSPGAWVTTNEPVRTRRSGRSRSSGG